MPRTVDDRIVILDIDEKSLKEEGRWPWGRDRLASLMDKLFDQYKVAVVGFDIVFAEKDESSELKVVHSLAQNQLSDVPQFQTVLSEIQPQLEYDKLFASKIKGRKAVLGYYLTAQRDELVSGRLPEPSFPVGTFKGRSIGFSTKNGYGANLPELQQAAAGAGHINPEVDFDGMVRRLPMLAEYNGAYYEPLSLAIVRTLLGQSELVPGFADDKVDGYSGLEWLKLRTVASTIKIPVDEDVATYVPYRGGLGSFVYISIADVLHGRVEPPQLMDKIVLIGTTALASRLEGITKQYAVSIIVGENTRNAVTDFIYRELDHVRVKGKDKPAAIYEPVGIPGEVSSALQDEIKLFHEMRRLYRRQDWDQAELQLMNLQRMSPDAELYGVYAKRVAHYRKNPPAADWDGVFVFQTK